MWTENFRYGNKREGEDEVENLKKACQKIVASKTIE